MLTPLPPSAPAPQSPIDPALQTMLRLIGGLGFRMLGARQLTYRNADLSLHWRMGSGSVIDAVWWQYDPATDTYTFVFTPRLGEAVRYEQVYAEDVLDLIEQQTGFYVTLYPRR